MKTIDVPKSQFKPKAFEYFRMVEKTGDQIRVTDRGKPVVKVVPVGDDDQRLLAEMRGLVKHYDDPLEPVGEAWEALE
ncbi:MAG: prevent-host-death protein [Armatimonadetes bacterium CG_4_10_14_3_um_filter_66_18]|nr:type II toxin-antitoxin system prevent-host-death family antitoxin [Armatimonadota bacterium]OIO97279.1 MAG: hypothetical protein AUJ96_23455 [Armatimonadetes bacterium CG2_30_66_41]PIU94289.1 MAG: prevent-host-death protein [Armatimonadetes bacterium CG06_land_8_20_14_3_00_66_21]PIX47481.1 MAG: prevent-host-death protein [Armatimonadetes bacterium CG_4_8_14_3_um_filter_66_20]PIY51599.1 MAG: prevent-host-death protein [Armatimonadetes bacterium CG_4_10_14_3_um_filter_66_18]PIZ32903.1 MAG: p